MDVTMLKKFLEDCGKIIVVGVGNPLSCVDRIGLDVVEHMRQILISRNVDLALAYNTPENILSKFLTSDHTHLLIVDAVDAGKKPGDVILIRYDEVLTETMTTHTIPMNLMLKAIEEQGKKTLIIGIQIPYERDFTQEEIDRIYEDINMLLRVIESMCGRNKNIF